MRTAKFSNLCCWLVVPALEKPLLEQRRREIHGIIKPITPLVVDTADSCSSMDDIATFVNAQRLLKIIVVVFIITWSSVPASNALGSTSASVSGRPLILSAPPSQPMSISSSSHSSSVSMLSMSTLREAEAREKGMMKTNPMKRSPCVWRLMRTRTDGELLCYIHFTLNF